MPQFLLDLNRRPRLPLFPPGALIALAPFDVPAGARESRRRTTDVRRRSAGWTMPLRQLRDSIAIGQIRCGSDRFQLRMIQRGAVRRGRSPVVQCRLTAFAYRPDIVTQLARSLRRSELRAARIEFQQRSPNAQLGHDLRIFLLLSLQSRGSRSRSARRHPHFESAWHDLLRTEHRRMLKRLRHAVRRLQRALSDHNSVD